MNDPYGGGPDPYGGTPSGPPPGPHGPPPGDGGPPPGYGGPGYGAPPPGYGGPPSGTYGPPPGYGRPGYGGPPSGSYGPPPGYGGVGGPPPPAPRRRGRALVVGGAVVVLALVAVGAAVALTRDGSSDTVDFGSGPTSEPEEDWTTSISSSEDVELATDGERIYVISEVEDEADEEDDTYSTTRTVTAFAAADGEELWEHELEGGFGRDDAVRPLDGDQVLVADYDEDTTALLEADTGDVVWEADGRPTGEGLGVGLDGALGSDAAPDVVVLQVEDDDGDGPGRIRVVDRADGDELWDTRGDEALVCGDVVITLEEDEDADTGSFTTPTGDITAQDATTGDERWTTEGFPGLCDDRDVVVGVDEDEMVLVDLGDGEEHGSFDVPGEGSILGIPAGDHVVISWFAYADGADEPETGVVVYERDGGDAVVEEDAGFGIPISDEHILVTDDEGEEVRLVRLSDGEEVEQLDLGSEETGSCTGTLTREVALFCSDSSPDVTAYDLADDFSELWTVDAGADVVEATVGGDRLFVVADDELIAFR